MENATSMIGNNLTSTREQVNMSSLSYISKIVSTDKELLQKMVQTRRPQSKNYEDSWGYIIQATRYEGFKWYDSYTDSLIFFGRKSENDPTFVVPNFFTEPAYLKHVVSLVQDTLNATQTILKNVNPEDASKLSSYGFRPYQEHDKWNKEARFDDQTYPQQIVDLHKLIEGRGKIYHKLRQALNKKPKVVIRRYCEKDLDEVLGLFALKDGNSENDLERAKGMYFVSHAMYPTADIDKYLVTDKDTDEIVGFIATSDISPKNTALVASIFKVGVKIASIWGIHQTLIAKYHEGFQLANLGGCETEGTYIFLKRIFRPVEELEKIHLVYDP